MTIVNHETGEIVETIGATEARRLTTEAQNEFGSSADHFARGWALIEEAVSGAGYLDLGYRSPGDYLHTEFDGVLSGLDVAARRVAVRSMTDWGLSTRAIAPVVGVTNKTVHQDRSAGVTSGNTSQSSVSESPEVQGITGMSTDSGAVAGSQGDGGPKSSPPPAITGMDGKTYPRPALSVVPKPKPPVVGMTDDEIAIEYVRTMAQQFSSFSQIIHANRRADLIAAWPIALGQVSPAMTDRFTPDNMRAVADGLRDLANEWENTDV